MILPISMLVAGAATPLIAGLKSTARRVLPPSVGEQRSAHSPIAVLATLVILFVAGCTASSRYMTKPKTPRPLAAPADSALVVFVRPSRFDKTVTFSVMDGNGRFLGDAPAVSHFAVRVPPGEHLFIAWAAPTAANTAVLRAKLAPGRVYYVQLDTLFGAHRLMVLSGTMRAKVSLLAIAPRTENWRDLKDWLEETDQMIPDEPQGQAFLSSHAQFVQDRFSAAKRALGQLDGKDLAAATLLPEDGVATTGAPSMFPPATSPAISAPAPAQPSQSASGTGPLPAAGSAQPLPNATPAGSTGPLPAAPPPGVP